MVSLVEVSIKQARLHRNCTRSCAMRFTIEERHLTDEGGKPIVPADAVTFHTRDADDPDAAVRLFITDDGGQLLAGVRRQASGVRRQASGVRRQDAKHNSFSCDLTPDT
jgi:hypothetical protein